jgi:hypothetical protein
MFIPDLVKRGAMNEGRRIHVFMSQSPDIHGGRIGAPDLEGQIGVGVGADSRALCGIQGDAPLRVIAVGSV